MSIFLVRRKRSIAISGLATTAVLGIGALVSAVGITHDTHQPSGSAASRVAVGLVASSSDRSAAVGSTDGGGNAHGRRLRAVLRDVTGRPVGWIRFTAVTGTGVVVQVHAGHLTPGFHGIHIHSRGVCDPNGTKSFVSAGPHLNPGRTAEGMQAGVLPVLLANPDGTADTRFVDARFTLADLTGPTGASVVVHAGPDNYAHIPPRYQIDGRPGPDTETRMTGDAGARVACAVIARPTAGAAAPKPAPSRTPARSHAPSRTGTPARDDMPKAVSPTSPTATPTPTVLYGHHW